MKSRTRHRHRPPPLSRKAKVVGATIGALLIWAIVAISLAAEHGYDADLMAAGDASTSQAATTSAVDQRLKDGDFAGAKVFATHALAASPISAAAARQLGLAEQGLGHWQQSGAIFSQAAALGWRDDQTQLWLAQAYLQQKNYTAAAERLDAVLRTNPNSTDLFDILDRLVGDKAFAAAIARRMILGSPWASRYLRYNGQVSVDALTARISVVRDLALLGSPPTRDELVPMAAGLVQGGDIARARALWFWGMHANGTIYDPRFEHVFDNGDASPFEWGLQSVLGATARVASDPSDPPGLKVTTDGTAAGIVVRQLISLSPGTHSLRFAGSIPAQARSAFGWIVRCNTRGGTILDTIGTNGLPSYPFVVPEGCGNQYLALRVTGDPKASNAEVRFTQLVID